jgi:hypothetical protein
MRRILAAAVAAVIVAAAGLGGAGAARAQATPWAAKPQPREAPTASARRYYVTGVADDQMGMLDWQTVRAEPDTGRAFGRILFVYRDTPSTNPRNLYVFLTAEVEFDCAGARWRTRSVTSLDADFNVLTSSEHDGDWRTVNPGSAAANFADAACHPGDIDLRMMSTATAPQMRARFLDGDIKVAGERT